MVTVEVCPLMDRATVLRAPTANVPTEASMTAIEQHATLIRRNITVRCGVQRRAMPSPSEYVEWVACVAEPLACIVAVWAGVMLNLAGARNILPHSLGAFFAGGDGGLSCLVRKTSRYNASRPGFCTAGRLAPRERGAEEKGMFRLPSR